MVVLRQFFNSTYVSSQQKIAYKFRIFSAGTNSFWVKSDSAGRPEYPRMQTVGQKENEMNMKDFVASGMTLPQGALGIAHALADMGGTDKDFTILINNRPLCDEVAKVILRRHFVTVGFPLPNVYPVWVKRLLYPDLAHIYCSSEFDVRTLERKLPVYVQGRIITGDIVYQFLCNRGMINQCLGLPELNAIQKKGIKFFEEYFHGLVVMGWRSISEHERGGYFVPGLSVHGGELLLGWYRHYEDFGPEDRPTFCFKAQ